jgi:hypothetical protein
MAYLAFCDETGRVGQVIVIPDGLPDPVAYGQRLGLKGTLVAAQDAEVPAIGLQHVEGRLYPVWRQVFGAGDDPLEIGETGFPKNVTVYHKGELWVSTVAVNVWEPGVSGWRKAAEPSGPAPWQQPTGAHDAYSKGDRVSHKGSVWVSAYGGNVWEPGVFGWSAE